jgi:peptidoglycan/LPS O-acetylase OafA/YrhL
MLKQKPRLQWIDSLRGIAAIMVAILHLWLLMRGNIAKSNESVSRIVSFFISDFFDLGKIGVVVFFLISGYVIPYSLYKASSKDFLISRFFRLYPAYWVAIICFCLIMGIADIKNTLINITMLQKFVGAEDLVGVFWTLQIELVFYFVCLVLHWLKLLNNDKFLVKLFYSLLSLTLIMAWFRYKLELKLPVALILGLAVMFLGMLWRKNSLEKSIYVTGKIFRLLIITLVVALVPITLLAYSKNYGNNETWYKYFVSYLMALLLFTAFSYYKFSGKFLVYLGTISYSMYLLHPIFGMELPFKIFTPAYYETHKLLFVVFFWTFSLIASSLCYYLIEKPSISIGKKLTGISNQQKSITTI